MAFRGQPRKLQGNAPDMVLVDFAESVPQQSAITLANASASSGNVYDEVVQASNHEVGHVLVLRRTSPACSFAAVMMKEKSTDRTLLVIPR